MHIRTSRVTRNGKTYEYAQLVDSFRRPSDGMPMHRVIARLGDVNDLAVRNLRDALQASRKGKRLIVAPAKGSAALKPTANLRYLDVAVLLELWRELELDALLDEVMPAGESSLPPASVVAALSIQRCVEPGSKLFAVRWVPRTALVELLDIPRGHFNNTRLHRVLDDLDAATKALMAKLPKRYAQRDGAFASLFLDVSDAWFVGHGPTMAERGKTKEGLIQRKIGIVLLCNEHGYPLRWEVIAGGQHDSAAMSRMLQSVAGLSWTAEAPVVCDRAMGHTAHLRTMATTGLRFLTALTVNEFYSYAPSLPHAPFASLQPQGDTAQPADLEQAARCAEAAGLHKAADNLFVTDLGVVVRAEESSDAPDAPSVEAMSPEQATVAAMRLCRQIEEAVALGRYNSYAAAGRAVGLSKSLTNKYRLLARLSEQQQRDVLEGKAASSTIAELIQIAAIESPEQQQHAFAALLATSGDRPVRTRAASSNGRRCAAAGEPQEPLRVRVVAYFNPERFVDERLRARMLRQRINAFVAELNTALAAPRCRHTASSIAAAVDRRLRQDSLLDVFDVRITETSVAGRTRYRVALVPDEAEWAHRRRYDGFTVLVAHPDLLHNAVDLCRLYRAKDAVEKDFQIIKSVIELRPIRHRDDAKVRAHVTLCMLALLLERTLQRRLAGHLSAEAALELLASCDVNLFAGRNGPPLYIITQPDTDQQAILRTLRLQHLVDDGHLAERITPR
jgi:hypothetical protein